MKRITLDLSGAILRSLASAQFPTCFKSSLRASVIESMLTKDSPMLKSSANEVLTGAWEGKSETKRLNKEGESTDP